MRLMGCVGAGADAEGREARKVNKQIEEQLAKDKQVCLGIGGFLWFLFIVFPPPPRRHNFPPFQMICH